MEKNITSGLPSTEQFLVGIGKKISGGRVASRIKGGWMPLDSNDVIANFINSFSLEHSLTRCDDLFSRAKTAT